MNGWPRLAPVVLAAVVSVGLVGWSLYSVSAEPITQVEPRAEAVSEVQTLDASWRTLLTNLTPTTTSAKEFRAPKELSTTDAIAQELVATKILLSNGTLSNANLQTALIDLAKRNVRPIEPNDTYTRASLKIASTSLETYAGNLRDAMESSGYVTEYELTTFAKTLKAENTRGTPELARAASLYRSVEGQLVRMPVPEALASEHLQLVKSVAFMARSVELMGGWTGDHADALTYIDAFARAERQVQKSLNDLGTAMVRYGKTS